MMGKGFDQAGRLDNLRARQAEIIEALMPDAPDVSASEEVDRSTSPGSTIESPDRPGQPSTSEPNAPAVLPHPSALDTGLESGWGLDDDLAKELSMSDFER